MKRILVIIDGMDDESIEALGGRTPRQAAFMPGLDYMCSNGRVKKKVMIPVGNAPATDVAMLNILGQKIPPRFSGRTWLEAMGAGIKTNPTDLCLRCNLIKISDGLVASHSGTNISDEEAKEIIDVLNRNYSTEDLRFYKGNGYRNILVVKNCDVNISAVPVHELVGKDIKSLLLKCNDKKVEQLLNYLIIDSQDLLLKTHHRADGIALWAPGYEPSLHFDVISGAMVAGVNLVKGIGRVMGMEVIDVDGATGASDTNYGGKLMASEKALKTHDYVVLHIEAADEASHEKDFRKKIEILEKIDRLVIGPLLGLPMEVEITVQADHATSSITGKHLDSCVDVVTYKSKKG